MIDYIKGVGYRLSAMEHIVPEQMFSTEAKQAHGISAVKALAIASNQGQKIWQIDQRNLNVALAAINVDADIESEITAAVYAGKVATVHEAPVNFEGGTNVGYLLIDPNTGAGAYKISGGANGGFLSDDAAGIWTWVGLSAGMLGLLAPVLFYIAAAIAVMLIIDAVLDFEGNCPGGGFSALIAFGVIVALAGIFAPPLIAIVLTYTALLLSSPIITIDSKLCK
ncbi:hypothetical protein [Rheinheimera sp. WS51]|uniref:hypothetical protein n=1 Tax=Rheinheimera sp. WS51 TaxID=3425886 RepID=UPI003D926C31